MLDTDPIIGAVVVARMNSSRLAGKSLAMIEGRSALEWIIRRLRRSRHIQRIVVATTTGGADDAIVKEAERLGCAVFRGSQDDVLGRVVGAIQSAKLDIVVHITGDCPLTDPALADACIEAYQSSDVDYVSIDLDAHPDGLDVEVFGADTLAKVEASFTDPWIREHVTLPLYTMPERFTALKLSARAELSRPDYRICVDTAADLELVQRIFAELLRVREAFDAADVVRLLDARPDLIAINASIKETKYPCAVIGLGAIGSFYERQPFAQERVQTHAKAFLRHGKTRLVAGCDSERQRRAGFQSDWDVSHVYATAQEMFTNHEIAIVSVATPPDSHAELCVQAIEAGVHAIFCEKPFTNNIEQAQRVIDACEQNGILLAVNFWRRWSRLYRSMREFISSGGLGKVQAVRFHYGKGAMNSGSHAVDLLRFLFGEIESVLATEVLHTDTGDPDIGGVLRMQSGLAIHLTIGDYRDHFDFEIDVIGSTGRLRSNDREVVYWRAETDTSEPANRTLAEAEPPFDINIGTPFETALAELVDHLDNQTHVTSCSGRDGLAALEVIQALKNSWELGGQWMSPTLPLRSKMGHAATV